MTPDRHLVDGHVPPRDTCGEGAAGPPAARRLRGPRRRGLLLLVVPALALAACGGGDDAPAGGGTVAAQGPAEAQTATVVGNARLEFVPNRITAAAGSLALTMEIEGGVPHNLIFDADTIGEDIATISEGSATGTFTFPQPGTYDFVCTLHPGMDGQVVVS